MSKKREDEPELGNIIPIHVPERRDEPVGRLVDPHLPLPGPIKRVKGQRPARHLVKAEKERYDRYLQLLVKTGGDPVPALCAVYDLPEEEVVARQKELHDKLVSGGDVDRSLDKLIADYDLTQPAVLGVLRMHLFSDHPAASLKAADKVMDMWGDTTVGESIEDLVRLALGEA